MYPNTRAFVWTTLEYLYTINYKGLSANGILELRPSGYEIANAFSKYLCNIVSTWYIFIRKYAQKKYPKNIFLETKISLRGFVLTCFVTEAKINQNLQFLRHEIFPVTKHKEIKIKQKIHNS